MTQCPSIYKKVFALISFQYIDLVSTSAYGYYLFSFGNIKNHINLLDKHPPQHPEDTNLFPISIYFSIYSLFILTLTCRGFNPNFARILLVSSIDRDSPAPSSSPHPPPMGAISLLFFAVRPSSSLGSSPFFLLRLLEAGEGGVSISPSSA